MGSQVTTNSWQFKQELTYFYGIYPYYTGSNQPSGPSNNLYLGTQATNYLDDTPYYQPSVQDNLSAYNYQKVQATGISGNLDKSINETMIMVQKGGSLQLEQINFADVSNNTVKYQQNVGAGVCRLAKVDCKSSDYGKEQLVITNLDTATNSLEVELCYFSDGTKTTLGKGTFPGGPGIPCIVDYNIDAKYLASTSEVVVAVLITFTPNANLSSSGGTIATKFFRCSMTVPASGQPAGSFSFDVTGMGSWNTSKYLYQYNTEVYLSDDANFVYCSGLGKSARLSCWQWNSGTNQYSETSHIDMPVGNNYGSSYYFYYDGASFWWIGQYLIPNGTPGADNGHHLIQLSTTSNGSQLQINNTHEINLPSSLMGDGYTSVKNMCAAGGKTYLQMLVWDGQNQHIYWYNVNSSGAVKICNHTLNKADGDYALNGGVFLVIDNSLSVEAPLVSKQVIGKQVLGIFEAPPVSNELQYYNKATKQYVTPSLSLSFSSEKDGSQSVQCETQRVMDKSLEASLTEFTASINGTLQQKLTSSASSQHTGSFTSTGKTTTSFSKQDSVWYAELNYDIYEYPVLQGSNHVGYFLFTTPTQLEIANIDDGTSAGIGLIANHQVGNLLSYYSKAAPVDPLYSSSWTQSETQGGSLEVSFDNKNHKVFTDGIKSSVESSIALKGDFTAIDHIGIGIQAKLKGTYDTSNITTTSYVLQESFQMTANLPTLMEENYGFKVNAYFYLDSNNVLRNSWQLDFVNKVVGIPNHWVTKMQSPYYGMVMPNFYNHGGDLYTTDLMAEENPDFSYTFSVIVRNWSSNSVSDLTVSFGYQETEYLDPLKPISQQKNILRAGAPIEVPTIPAHSNKVIAWTSPKGITNPNNVSIYPWVEIVNTNAPSGTPVSPYCSGYGLPFTPAVN